MSRTKIIATVGPAISSKSLLHHIVKAGASVIRFNFSHGSYEHYRRHVRLIHQISQDLDTAIGIMCDFQGPKLRIGSFSRRGGVILKRNQEFVITSKNVKGTEEGVSARYPNFYQLVRKNQEIYLNDGLIHLRVLRIRGQEVVCKVIEGGQLSDHKGINLPALTKTLPIPTKKDREDIRFAIDQGLNLFAFSFVQTPEDIHTIRHFLKENFWDGMLISKIEKPKAVENLDEIIRLSDGLLVARGDLGVEMNLEQVPIVQKQMIQKCNDMGKLVITATQMLESMVSNLMPTRAEVSDVANAVFDGTDAVMLSAETASGKFPVQSVKVMSRIVKQIEQGRTMRSLDVDKPHTGITHVVTASAVHAAQFLKARAIVCHTESGQTALNISKFHPTIPVYAFTPNMDTFHRMSIYYGVTPILTSKAASTEKMITMGDQQLLRKRFCRPGDKVVIVAGEVQARGATNMIKIHTL